MALLTDSYIQGPGFMHNPSGPRVAGTYAGATSVGYIGDNPFNGFSSIYYLGGLNSSASTNASSNMFNFYTSGHWGQYTKVFVSMVNEYYAPGYALWYIADTTATLVNGYGSYGSLSITQTMTGSGTHGGQNVYRYNVTVNNPGTYHQTRWYMAWMGGGTNGHYSNAYSQSTMDTFFNSNGGGVHFFTLTYDNIKNSPHTRTL